MLLAFTKCLVLELALGAQQAAAAGAADAIVATDNITIGDFFEGGPTMTIENWFVWAGRGSASYSEQSKDWC